MACGPDVPSAGESASDMFSAIYDYYPLLSRVFREDMPKMAQAELQTAQQVSPAYQQLATDLYKQFGPQLAQVGQGIDASNRLAAANADVNILQGPGKQLAQTYKEIDQGLNPEYYQVREQNANKLEELLGSINLNDANPEAERLISQENARSGNLSTPSATGTVSNALSFGDAMNGRRAALSSAINAATSFLQPASSASAFNPATTALQRPTSNTGASEFAGVNSQAGQSALTQGQNYTNQIGTLQQGRNQALANQRDALDRVHEGLSSV